MSFYGTDYPEVDVPEDAFDAPMSVRPVRTQWSVTSDPPTETGSVVLDDVRAWLARFVTVVRGTDLDILTLWAAHTHLCAETYTSPRLLIDSPMPGSGKTTCLEHLQRLCVAPMQMASVSSPALLVRVLEKGVRTLLIDEADRTLNPDQPEIRDLLAILNSGYKRGATRPVLVPVKGGGWETAEMPTFAPVAMAGNNPHLPDDTRSRCLRVLLLPDLRGEAEESDWELIEDDARRLGARLSAWAVGVSQRVRDTRPELPAPVRGRARERWLPLARVGAVAGGRWVDIVPDLAVADVEQIERDREDGMMTKAPHVLLLEHMRECWPEAESFTQTTHLIDLLVAEHPDVWGESSPYGKRLTAQRMGRMLATSYGLNSGRLDGARGYRRAEVANVWQRMGMEPMPVHPQGVGIEPTTASEPAEPTCTVCGSPLHRSLVAAGAAIHPVCQA